ncbi:MAG: hypothetical protein K6E19_03775 [Lachnospiraceae bacterium]|nr:hypothetical protein [Lachnospiraceae bacterium]
MQLSTDDNRPIELHVKRDGAEDYQELDLVNVFVNMGKKKRIYAWLIVACMLLGLTIPLALGQLKGKIESVSTVITFLYPGADQEYAPGELAKITEDPTYEPAMIDVGELKSSYVLRNAVNQARLSTEIPLAAIEGNIRIERMLTEESRRSIEAAEKALEADKKNFENAMQVLYEYSGKYAITLSNGFTTDPKGRHKVYLSDADMASLLNSIAGCYNEYFFKTYMRMEFPENKTDIIKDEKLDYIERLDEMVSFLESLSAYCIDETKGEYLLIPSKLDGLSLNDINDCIRLVRTSNVDYLYAYVFYNSVAKSNDNMVTRYEYLLRDLNNKLDAMNGEIANNESLITEYRNDEIIVNLSEQGTGQMSTAATDKYNQLILEQAGNYKERTEMQVDAENMADKLNGLKTRYSYAAEIKYVDDEVNALAEICEKLYKLTSDHAAEIMDSEAYRNSFMTHIDAQYTASSLFSPSMIKKMLIGMVAGAFAAFVLWGFDGLAIEFMRGRKQEEEKEVQE